MPPHFFYPHRSAEHLSTKHTGTEGNKKVPKFNSVRLTKRVHDVAPPHRAFNRTVDPPISISAFLAGPTEQKTTSVPSKPKRRRSLTKSNVYKKITSSIFPRKHFKTTFGKRKGHDIQEWALLDHQQPFTPDRADIARDDDNLKRDEPSSGEDAFHSVRSRRFMRDGSGATQYHTISSTDREEIMDGDFYRASSFNLLEPHHDQAYSHKTRRILGRSSPIAESSEDNGEESEKSTASVWTTDLDSIIDSPPKSAQDLFQTPSDQRTRSRGSLSSLPFGSKNGAKSSAKSSPGPFDSLSGIRSGNWPPRNPFRTPSDSSNGSQYQNTYQASSNKSTSSSNSHLYISRANIETTFDIVSSNEGSNANERPLGEGSDPQPKARTQSLEAAYIDTETEEEKTKKVWKKIRHALRASSDTNIARTEIRNTDAFRRVASASDTTGIIATTGWQSRRASTNRASVFTDQADTTDQGTKEWKHAASNFFPAWARDMPQERAVEIILENRAKVTGKVEAEWHSLLPWLKSTEEDVDAGKSRSRETDFYNVEQGSTSAAGVTVGSNDRRNVSNTSWGSFRNFLEGYKGEE